jgi:hypothetical protein
MAFDILVSSVTHSRSALRSSHFPHPGLGLKLLRSLLTSRSGTGRQAFTHKARSPRVRTHSFAAQPPDLRHRSLDHKSFAVSCPLALPGSAFYPVLVHRLAASLYASSPRSVALTQLRFASFAVINSREDLHLQECARAGRTSKKARTLRRGPVQPADPRGSGSGGTYMSMPMPPMPPMPPPPPGIAGASSFGASATMHSVVSIRPATDAAFCSAVRVTLVGSRMPISIMSP